MASFTDVSTSFAHLSMSLAEDCRQAGNDERASMFIELARAIFDLNEDMVARGRREVAAVNGNAPQGGAEAEQRPNG